MEFDQRKEYDMSLYRLPANIRGAKTPMSESISMAAAGPTGTPNEGLLCRERPTAPPRGNPAFQTA